ncbi:hypothetical protein GRF29_106g77685 [Pseudopithomyces chartarum]|uniref:Uncharacterized protein n=1 Tax=Pseudopithomyces chartarum TaxID=1892770 RepID=A0AAN6LVN9_9PLEO|nr:hypothetical protein GRF29_106g77685 [Pseudopithomyces chartarum]
MVYSQLIALAALPGALAAPRPQIAPIASQPFYCPILDKSEETNGQPWQIGRSVDGGESVGVETSHSVGITWEKGGELGIGGGDLVTLAAGASFSVAEQVTDATAESGDKLCPEGPWHCSAVFYPWGVKMSGHFHKLSPTESCDTAALGAWTHDVEEGTPWEAWAPKKDAAGNGFGTLEICTCENMEHWADDGHPALLCPEGCAKGADNK